MFTRPYCLDYVNSITEGFADALAEHTEEQGLFFIDRQGLIRHRLVVGPIDPIPGAAELAAVIREQ